MHWIVGSHCCTGYTSIGEGLGQERPVEETVEEKPAGNGSQSDRNLGGSHYGQGLGPVTGLMEQGRRQLVRREGEGFALAIALHLPH